MGMAEKVVKFENESMKIYEAVKGWIKDLNRNNRDYEDLYDGKRSKTQIAYEADVRLFLRYTRGKKEGSELEYLTLDELQFTLEDLEDFKDKILELRNEDGKYAYTNKSFNRKLSGIKNFIRFMAKKKLIKDISFLELVTSEKEKDEHYGALEVSQVFDMAEWALKHERELGNVKRLAILFSLDSCIRKSAMLRLKWSDFTIKEDGVEVKGIDKGNKEFRQLISMDFYNELLTIKDEISPYVFNISVNAIDSMMNRYRKSYNIPEERRIVWHSIRKSGVTFRFRVTGDILEAKRAANHSSITTTQIYLEEQDYGQIGAVSSVGNIDKELFKKVDYETLIKAIGLLKKDTQLILNLKLQELMKNN
jgi:site-specific recombinase XerD